MILGKWNFRLIISFILTLIILLISFIKEGTMVLNYINLTFFIGLALLTLSATALIITAGFFDIFVLGWKKTFSNEDPYTDKSHWSYDDDSDTAEKRIKTRELLLYLPFFIAIALISQSFVLLLLFY